MKTSLNTSKRAFTIIELLVVIAIIAILTGIVMTNLTGSKAKARDAKRVSDLGQIQQALELYFDRCKEYPETPDIDLADSNGCPSGSSITLGTFLSKKPTPPGVNSNDIYDYTPYDLDYDGVNESYLLRAVLESASPALQDDIDENPDNAIWSSEAIGAVCDDAGAISNQYCIISN